VPRIQEVSLETQRAQPVTTIRRAVRAHDQLDALRRREQEFGQSGDWHAKEALVGSDQRERVSFKAQPQMKSGGRNKHMGSGRCHRPADCSEIRRFSLIRRPGGSCARARTRIPGRSPSFRTTNWMVPALSLKRSNGRVGRGPEGRRRRYTNFVGPVTSSIAIMQLSSCSRMWQ